jgi:prophage regulatory protein
MQDIKIYRIRDVCEKTGLKPSTIYKMVRENAFPKSIQLTARSTGWPSNLVGEWLDKKMGK